MACLCSTLFSKCTKWSIRDVNFVIHSLHTNDDIAKYNIGIRPDELGILMGHCAISVALHLMAMKRDSNVIICPPNPTSK
jgi:hypothetical protein